MATISAEGLPHFSSPVPVRQQLLWTGSHYRVYRDEETGRESDAVLVSQLVGEWFAAICGLAGVFPATCVEQAQQQIPHAWSEL